METLLKLHFIQKNFRILVITSFEMIRPQCHTPEQWLHAPGGSSLFGGEKKTSQIVVSRVIGAA